MAASVPAGDRTASAPLSSAPGEPTGLEMTHAPAAAASEAQAVPGEIDTQAPPNEPSVPTTGEAEGPNT